MSDQELKIVIITGLSGSGKSTALAALEDASFFCVDNLPVALLPKFLELHLQRVSDVTKLAFVMDLREKEFLQKYEEVFLDMKQRGFDLEIVFLEASEESLLRRYAETRRHHPLSGDKGLLEGIRTERKQLAGLRSIADRIIDTSQTNVHDLKALIRDHVEKSISLRAMHTHVISFGFKYGIPHEADLVMDVRFLPNPFFVPELKEMTGEDEPVQVFLNQRRETIEFMDKYIDFIDFLIPKYEQEGKSYLTLAIGCTGGRHRSVVIAKKVSAHLEQRGRRTTLAHRDMAQKHGTP